MPPVIEGFRASPQQRRLLALPGSRRGGVTWAAVHLAGALDPAALRAALEAVAAEREALRTRLVGEPASGLLQVIGDHAPAWETDVDVDAGGPGGGALEARLDAWAAEAAAAAADPSRPPLVRAVLVRLGAGEHLLRLAVPAALADAATLARVVERLAAAYAGDAPPAGDEMQFADVSEWQNDFLDGEESAEGRRHWAARLAAARATPRLPGDAGDDDAAPAPPRLLAVPAAPDLLPRLEAAAAAVGVPATALALAGWAALLHRLTGQPEARLAAAVDGRGFAELAGVAGPFARFLPLAVPVSGDTPVAALAAALRAELAEAARVQDAFPADGDGPAAPLGFAWQPLPAPVRAGGIAWTVRATVACPEPFRAALLCTPSEEGPGARLLHDPARLPDDAAARLAEEAAAVLEAVARAPRSPVAALEVVGARERAHLLETLAPGPPRGGEADETVVSRILAQSDAAPERPALCWEGGALTYGGLAARSGRLAARLHALGVGPETRAAILLERGGPAVVALLAVLRAGGAYLPLDPAYPRERLAFMLRDAGAAVLLTDAAGAPLAGDAGCRVVRMDADGDDVPDGPDGAALPLPRPGHAAYVIYTSGTTGRPKGTLVEHGALAAYVRGASATLDLPAGAAYAVVSTLAADLGSTMLFPALCLGGTLHVPSRACATDPEAWAAYAARHGIDCLKLVPSHLRLLLEGADPAAALPRLRLVLGGEAPDPALLAHVRALAPALRVFNHYGPTETTVGVVAGELAAGGDDARPPLGRPLPGARVYLLDPRGRLAPTGAPGEVHVGGATLSRGYPGRPAETAARFVPDPFAGRPGARAYRTGDLARWGADGRLAFLGRLDDQVKVAGWRVEPAEVEAALAASPGVAAARVVARPGEGGTRLVAYLVPAGEGAPDEAELRRHLLERLPEPFVPTAFVTLPRLPLTPNGKVDLRALPDPEPPARAPRVPPRDETEAALADVWEAVLGREGVGATDDFFALGGNSFLAVRLMARIHRRFGRRLPLAALIAAGTVERMARLLEGDGGGAEHLVEIRAGTGADPLFCVHPGEGTVLCYRDLARHLDPAWPVHGVQALDFELARPPLVEVEEMAARYVELLAERHPAGPVRLAGWSFGGLVAFEMARQLAERGREVGRVLLFDTRLPITAPALAEVDPALFRLGMLLPASALVVDGRPVVAPGELAGLDPHAQLALVAGRRGVDAASLLPAHVPAERLEHYLEVRMARTRGVQAYAWRPAPVRVTLFRAAEVELDTPFPALREAFARAAATPDYGWGALTPEPVEVVTVPGTHHTLVREPHARALARAVDARLSAAGG